MDKTEGFQCLGHSNWTLCSLLSQFCSPNFPPFSLSYWRPILITPDSGRLKMGKMEISQPEWHTRVLVPGAFKLDHLSQFCSENFPRFWLWYWEANSYYPRERKAENGKMDFSHSEWERGFQCLGNSNWTICSHLSQFSSPDFPTFSLLYWRGKFLLSQREEGWKWENGILPTWARHKAFSAWGIQTGPFAAD